VTAIAAVDRHRWRMVRWGTLHSTRRRAGKWPCRFGHLSTRSEEALLKQQVEVFFHSQQPYTYVQDADLAQYPSGRLDFPNRYFDPVQAHALYNQYHEQYAWADEVGVDGIMTNEHHAAY
jgi:hypothetical protein